MLLVLSRVISKEKDKDLRFKCQALADVTPQDFGVDQYLLLNEQTPLVQMAESQNLDFERFERNVISKSILPEDWNKAKKHDTSLADSSAEIFEGINKTDSQNLSTTPQQDNSNQATAHPSS